MIFRNASNQNELRTLFTIAVIGLCTSAVPGHAQTSRAVHHTDAASIVAGSADPSIRPFRVDVPQEALTDLRRRLADTRWPESETVSDRSQGVPLATLKSLVSYWQKSYDWRKGEAKLNALPQFMTMIDGLDIHFIHVRSKHPNALPIIITHGWPGSIIEQLKIIGPLTDPTAYGGKTEDSFDVVVPSLPARFFR